MTKRKRGFGQLRRLPSKRVQAFYTGPDTGLHYAPATFDTFEDAEAWLAAERRLISLDEWTPPPAERQKSRHARGITLAEYAGQWLDSHRRSDGKPLKARTLAHYRKLLDTRILPELGDLELKHVSESMVKVWLRTLEATRPRPTPHTPTRSWARSCGPPRPTS